jgi:Rod binding domain-containing protein
MTVRLDSLGLEGLPPLSATSLPAEVRNGTPEDRKLYSVALGFERLLVQQLTEQLAESSTTFGDDEDGEGAGASLGMLRDQLPSILADGITAAGGIGLAPELYRALRGTVAETDRTDTADPEGAA